MRRWFAVAAICVSACAPAGPQELQIVSKGGPLVAVIVINGAEVARVECNGGIVLRPLADVERPVAQKVPPLPWDLRVVDQRAGRMMLRERVSELPRWLVIFRDSAGISTAPVLGPFVPCAASAP